MVLSLIWNYVLKFIVFFVTYLRWISIFDELRVAIILNLSKMLDFRSNFSVGINDSLNFKFRTVGSGLGGPWSPQILIDLILTGGQIMSITLRLAPPQILDLPTALNFKSVEENSNFGAAVKHPEV